MEYRDLYDENRIPTGEKIEKSEPVPAGRFYVTVAVFMQNSKNEFLMQRRSKEKGGKWATTGGHPKSGETSLQGIVTEIKEELGIDVDPKNLIFYHTIKTTKDFVDFYYLNQDFDLKDLTLQKEEVQDARWFTIEEIEDLIKKDDFFKSHIDYIKNCLEFLSKNKKLPAQISKQFF